MVKGKQIKKIAVKSPGMKYRHYAPNAKVILVEGKYERVKNKIQELTDKYKKKGKKIAIMTTNKNHNYKTGAIKFIGKDCDAIAKNLFKTFREFDKEKIDLIIAEGVSDNGLGLAVMNRLRKASYKIICI